MLSIGQTIGAATANANNRHGLAGNRGEAAQPMRAEVEAVGVVTCLSGSKAEVLASQGDVGIGSNNGRGQTLSVRALHRPVGTDRCMRDSVLEGQARYN